MPLEPGESLGPYVVVAPAGAGGMGEVYKARDTRLDRIVALKVIAGALGDQSEFRRRFAAEARAIAALNHPHICTLYDTGHHDGREFLVLEYLEGETLAQRLRRGPLPVPDLFRVAIEIADALAYAHRRGIVHRDLKPANVLLTRSAGAKLLDFGVATLRSATARSDAVSDLATKPLPASRGSIVGTLNYLAPERFDGREADARSDIFAFGATLYEMATGRKAFEGQGEARLIASILSSEPSPIDPASGVPSDVQWLVEHCLVKDPDARWQSMVDVVKVLKGLRQAPHLVSSHSHRRALGIWVAIAALTGAALGAGALLRRQSMFGNASEARRTVSLSVLPPIGGTFGLTQSSVKSAQFAVAPDGQSMVFVAAGEGGYQLWIREFGRTDPRPIPNTAGASYPFWSADGRFVGFFAEHSLKKVGLTGRASQIICKAENGRGGAWRQDGTIVFSSDTSTPLSRTDASGMDPVELTTLGAGHLAHRWPRFLPDGRVLFFVRSANAEVQGLYVTSIDKPQGLQRIRAAGSSGLYAAGQLLFVLDGELVAQPLDATTLQLSKEAVPLGLKVDVSSTGDSAMSASNQSVLATWSSAGAMSELVWYDREGKRLGTTGAPDRYVDFRLSPDDRRLALSRVDAASNTPDLAILELDRNALTVLPSSSQTDASPVWSPDGKRLVFRSNRRGPHDLFERPADGGGQDQFIHSEGFGLYPTDWSADGSTIIFHGVKPSTKHDIWALDRARRKARPLVQTAAEEAQGQLASGSRLAYTSDESGALQVYVRSLDGAKGPANVSVTGGFDPRWRADGHELFFISREGTLMSVEFPAGDGVEPGPVRQLFQTPIHETSAPYLSSFVVTRDGRRFLINNPIQPKDAVPITVTLDWPNRVGSSDQGAR